MKKTIESKSIKKMLGIMLIALVLLGGLGALKPEGVQAARKKERLENEIINSLSDAEVEYIIAVSGLITKNKINVKDKLVESSIEVIIESNNYEKDVFKRLMAYCDAFKRE